MTEKRSTSVGVNQEGTPLRSVNQQQEPELMDAGGYLLSELLRVARFSNCDKRKFGAAALDINGSILAYGWNHIAGEFPALRCDRDCVGRLRKGIKSGTCVERCFAIHAEQHAILVASRPVYEIAVAGLLPDGSLFDNGDGFYCTVCARIMVTAGVKFVSYWSEGERQRVEIADAWAESYNGLST